MGWRRRGPVSSRHPIWIQLASAALGVSKSTCTSHGKGKGRKQVAKFSRKRVTYLGRCTDGKGPAYSTRHHLSSIQLLGYLGHWAEDGINPGDCSSKDTSKKKKEGNELDCASLAEQIEATKALCTRAKPSCKVPDTWTRQQDERKFAACASGKATAAWLRLLPAALKTLFSSVRIPLFNATGPVLHGKAFPA